MQGKRRRIRSRERALSVSPVDLFVSLSSSTSLSFSDRHQLVSLHGKWYNHLCRKLLKVATITGEHEEVFKVADKYVNLYHDQVIECMKRIKELPLMSDVVKESEDDEPTCHLLTKSLDTEHAHSEPTESLHTEGAPSNPTASVHTESTRLEPIEIVNTESVCPGLTEKQVTFVDSMGTQIVRGIKVKPKV
ncbi:uncharacterized protein LOC131235218 isoform X1 [Magnolia sinica]|uniref:uncharacterized protein LOC131235218 isoform X1 n=1 Tax=Magnolia sinica TaxID=86752 RepID=UPI0026598FD0|nr:uncharacterized protein LOC131235218 isoform X1 [Magnolia sinica]